MVAGGEAELGVRAVGGDGGAGRFALLPRRGSPAADDAARRLAAYLRAVNDEFREGQLREAGAEHRGARGLLGRTGRADRAGAGIPLATVVPLILLLMTATGAVYPAIDLTAGERERGTLETLIAAPVPRLWLLSAKFLAVWAVAVLTAAANLVAMSVTIYGIGLDAALFGEGGLSFAAVASVFALLCLTAVFFAAVVLAVTSSARSFKEAQAYLIPLMLCSLAPGGLALTPGIELNSLWAAVPLVNLVLLTPGGALPARRNSCRPR